MSAAIALSAAGSACAEVAAKCKADSPRLLLSTLVSEKLAALAAVSLPTQKGLALATYLSSVIVSAFKAYANVQVFAFDANPGDGGCQLRALILRELFSQKEKLLPPFQALEEKAKKVKMLVGQASSNFVQKKEQCLEFVKVHFGAIEINREIAFLLKTHLLYKLKVKDFQRPDGVIVTKTSFSGLSQFAPKIDFIEREHREAIVCEAQTKTSEMSQEFVCEIGAAVKSLSGALTVHQMVAHKHVKSLTAGYPPKHFVCLFYAVRVVLSKLRDEGALIAIKSIPPKGSVEKPYFLFLKPPQLGKEFQFLEAAAIQKLKKEELVVVFEAVIGNQEVLQKTVAEAGFTEIVLQCAALESPFEPGTTVEALPSEGAKKEVSAYLAAKEKPPFSLDHVYCTTLGKEGVL